MSSETKKPPVPKGTGASGRKLWSSIVAEYELEQHEMAMLAELVRLVDRLDRLDVIIRREGPIVDGGKSGPKAHPALVEARQLQIAQARLTAALRLPVGDEGDVKRPQRRGGVKGVYGIKGAVS